MMTHVKKCFNSEHDQQKALKPTGTTSVPETMDHRSKNKPDIDEGKKFLGVGEKEEEQAVGGQKTEALEEDPQQYDDDDEVGLLPEVDDEFLEEECNGNHGYVPARDISMDINTNQSSSQFGQRRVRKKALYKRKWYTTAKLSLQC